MGRNGDLQHLALAGNKLLCLRETAEAPCRFSQRSLGRLAVDLGHLLPGCGPCIGDFDPKPYLGGSRPAFPAALPRCLTAAAESASHAPLLHPRLQEGGIGEAEAEGIEHFVFGKGLEVAVAYVDVLLVEVPLLIAVVAGGRIVRYVPGDGVRQLPGRGYRAGQHVQHAVAALLASLPYVQHRRRPVALHPFHVYDIAYVEEHHRAPEGPAD